MDDARAPRGRVHLALLAVQLGFGTLPVAGKLTFEDIPPYGVAVLRVVMAGACYFMLARAGLGSMTNKRGGVLGALSAIPMRDRVAIAGCGILGMAVNQVFFLGGLEKTTAINATILVTTIPVFTFLIAVLLRRERGSAVAFVGVVVALVGVLYLIGLESFRLGSATLVGDLMIVINAFAYGAYLVLVRRFAQKYGAIAIMGIAFPAAAVVVAPLGIPELLHATYSPRSLALIGYIIAVPTLFTYLVNAWALRRAPASLVAVYIYLQPIVGAMLAVLVLEEQLNARIAISAIAVFFGITLVARRARSSIPRDALDLSPTASDASVEVP